MGFGIYWRQQIGHPVADSSLILFLLTCCRRCSQGLGNCRCPRDWSSFHLVLMVLQSDPKKRTMLFSHMMHVNSSVVELAVAWYLVPSWYPCPFYPIPKSVVCSQYRPSHSWLIITKEDKRCPRVQQVWRQALTLWINSRLLSFRHQNCFVRWRKRSHFRLK